MVFVESDLKRESGWVPDLIRNWAGMRSEMCVSLIRYVAGLDAWPLVHKVMAMRLMRVSGLPRFRSDRSCSAVVRLDMCDKLLVWFASLDSCQPNRGVLAVVAMKKV